MKKLLLICFAVCFCAVASAQKVYFLYLQSDNQTPFYLRIGDKIYSSSSSGYLIMPNLTDSTYNFGVGFAKSTAAEAKFSVSINQNDKGFIIKNFDDGLALFNIQDLSLVKANTISQDNTVYETKSDPFSTTLSKAANDPALLKVPVARKEEPVKIMAAEKEAITTKTEETKPVLQTDVDTTSVQPQTETAQTETPAQGRTIMDTLAATQMVAQGPIEPVVQPAQQEEKKEAVEAVAAVFMPSVISRYTESSTTEGFGVVYFDKKESGIDTIRILIPAPKVKLVAETDTAATTEIVTKEGKADTLVIMESKEIESDAKANTSSATVVNLSNCKNTASDKDFLKLRRKMASKDIDDEMLDEARKEFRSKCYSVEQVRNLSALFLTSASKYRFFDAAFEHVSDRSNFASLSSEIKDEHYTKRFKALIGE